MKNLLDSTEIATVFLDTDLCVRRFTPAATTLLPLERVDAGRPISHFASNLLDVDLAGIASMVLNNLAVHERNVRSNRGRSYTMRIRPYRTVANVIDGVVVTFEDFTERHEIETRLREARDLAEKIVDTIRESLLVLDDSLVVMSANRSFYDFFKVKESETVGRPLYELGNGQWDIPGVAAVP